MTLLLMLGALCRLARFDAATRAGRLAAAGLDVFVHDPRTRCCACPMSC
jgi:lactate dehydrogenase-like 2-hydroxyacid dehydrogenase